MKKIKYIIIILFLILNSDLYSDYPGKNWLMYKTPEEAGWSSNKLKDANKLYNQMNASAVMVIYNGNILLSYGDVNRRFLIHSIRKSIISALYGIYVDEGKIDINNTLEKLNIGDNDSLTETESQAKISDLLKARSGIYIPAASEIESMKKNRPARGSHNPGEYWYYNNWDFNALGSILEKETGRSVFIDFENHLAEPLQMEDFRLSDGFYNYEVHCSKYPAYLFKMSARDLARFGLLYLMDGKWNGKQIISESWIKESIQPYTEMKSSANFTGYGYLWWLSKPFHQLGAYCASGLGGQFIYIIPKSNLVFVFRANTYQDKFVSDSTRIKFMELVIKSKTGKPKSNPKLKQLSVSKPLSEKFKLKQTDLKGLEGKYLFKIINDTAFAEIKLNRNELFLKNNTFGNIRLLPQTKNKFIMEDVLWNLEFVPNKSNKMYSIIISYKEGKKIIKLIGKPIK
ncbi:MAG: serine hydrolase [Ignavibacteriae bacterium]|nr:serine hydrolase [Ignavibacteriota bacterium]